MMLQGELRELKDNVLKDYLKSANSTVVAIYFDGLIGRDAYQVRSLADAIRCFNR